MGNQNALPPPPLRNSLVDQTGAMTNAWSIWFSKLIQRVGGPYSPTLAEIAAQIAALEATVTGLQAEVTTLSGDVSTLSAQVAAINLQIATINGQITDLQTQMSAVQSALAAGINATITTAALSSGGTEGSMTFVGGILTGQVQAT
jgi:prefoldin subunit 5